MLERRPGAGGSSKAERARRGSTGGSRCLRAQLESAGAYQEARERGGEGRTLGRKAVRRLASFASRDPVVVHAVAREDDGVGRVPAHGSSQLGAAREEQRKGTHRVASFLRLVGRSGPSDPPPPKALPIDCDGRSRLVGDS